MTEKAVPSRVTTSLPLTSLSTSNIPPPVLTLKAAPRRYAVVVLLRWFLNFVQLSLGHFSRQLQLIWLVSTDVGIVADTKYIHFVVFASSAIYG